MTFDPTDPSPEEIEAAQREWLALANAAMPELSPTALPDLIARCLDDGASGDEAVARLVDALNTDDGFTALLAGVDRVRDLYMRVEAMGLIAGHALDRPRRDADPDS